MKQQTPYLSLFHFLQAHFHGEIPPQGRKKIFLDSPHDICYFWILQFMSILQFKTTVSVYNAIKIFISASTKMLSMDKTVGCQDKGKAKGVGGAYIEKPC